MTLADKLHRDVKDIDTLLSGLATALRDHCAVMESVAVPGFGTFQPVKEDERILSDLSTGRRTLLPPEIRLTFSPSNMLVKKIENQ